MSSSNLDDAIDSAEPEVVPAAARFQSASVRWKPTPAELEIMIDPFAIVGDRVRYWSEINNPKDGKGTYVPSKSSMRIHQQDIVFGEVLPGEITPDSVTFKVHTTGMMVGVVGESFTVRTDEYALDGTPVALTTVVDRGFWADGKVVSVPALALRQSA